MKLRWLASLTAVLLSTLSCSKAEDAPAPVKKSPASTPSAAMAAQAAPPVQVPPASLGKINTPKDNPTTPEKAELGRKLFFDKRLSGDGRGLATRAIRTRTAPEVTTRSRSARAKRS